MSLVHMSGIFEKDAVEIFEEIAHNPLVENVGEEVGRHVAEEGIHKVVDFLDFDDDGSILDTLPDLIAAGVEGLLSLFG
jgi:hypothetical protein